MAFVAALSTVANVSVPSWSASSTVLTLMLRLVVPAGKLSVPVVEE